MSPHNHPCFNHIHPQRTHVSPQSSSLNRINDDDAMKLPYEIFGKIQQLRHIKQENILQMGTNDNSLPPSFPIFENLLRMCGSLFQISINQFNVFNYVTICCLLQI
jgi:hypothetical protein